MERHRTPAKTDRADTVESPPPLSPVEWSSVVRALGLSPRQADIVGQILLGMRDKQIATTLGMSLPTVRTHLRHIFARQYVADRVELVLLVFATLRGKPGDTSHPSK
jgi:DNA-binding CsgD family transcriptional regulator